MRHERSFGRATQRLEVVRLRSIQFATLLLRVVGNAWSLLGAGLGALLAPMLIGLVLAVAHVFESVFGSRSS